LFPNNASRCSNGGPNQISFNETNGIASCSSQGEKLARNEPIKDSKKEPKEARLFLDEGTEGGGGGRGDCIPYGLGLFFLSVVGFHAINIQPIDIQYDYTKYFAGEETVGNRRR
jgi:hypothetical protein